MHIIGQINGSDWNDICLIFKQGIDGGNATFATSPPNSFEEWMEGKNGIR